MNFFRKVCRGVVDDTTLSYERLLLQEMGLHAQLLQEKDLHVQYLRRALISVSIVAVVVILLFAVLTYYLLVVRDEQRRRMENLYQGIITEKNKRIQDLEESPKKDSTGHSLQQQHFVYAMPTLHPAK